MIRSLPSITTTVSSDREIGLYQAWSPDACTSRALGRKFLHFSNRAMFCRVSVFTGPQGGDVGKNEPEICAQGAKTRKATSKARCRRARHTPHKLKDHPLRPRLQNDPAAARH